MTPVRISIVGVVASLLLILDERCRVLGQRSGLILAPMRDLVMWMPLDTDPEFAAWWARSGRQGVEHDGGA